MSIKGNLDTVRKDIAAAAAACGRRSEDIKLIAVSKTKPMSDIIDAYKCGIRNFGENRPQELAEKFPQLSDVSWHMIGSLQKNKVRHIIDKAALIHSVDSIALAEEIEKRAGVINKVQDILIQVNISGEETKSGVRPEDAGMLCRTISQMKHIHICGLMTISVRGMSYEENKKIFGALRELACKIEDLKIPGVSMKELSMGMTHDYQAAIEAGATIIRVGTGIFGTRDYSKL